jgi:hypothetical protein
MQATVAQPKLAFGIDDVSKCYNGSLFVKGIMLGQVDKLSVRTADGIFN